MRLRESEQRLKEVQGSQAALKSELGLARERAQELESAKQLLIDEARGSKAALATSLAAQDQLRKVILIFSSFPFVDFIRACLPFVDFFTLFKIWRRLKGRGASTRTSILLPPVG